jgi:hypothetical protein
MNEILGKIVIVTKMRKIPKSCSICKYYDCMGGVVGRYNDGVCTANGNLVSTRGISTSKDRLKNCPLILVEGENE